jgi:hypothetical protein
VTSCSARYSRDLVQLRSALEIGFEHLPRALIVGAALAACSTASLPPSPGTEGQKCLIGDGCAEGLVCLSGLCVDPGADAAPAGVAQGDAAAPSRPGDAGAPPEAAPDPSDAAVPSGTCDPAQQTGCPANSKCAFVLDSPLTGSGHVGCSRNGTEPAGASCLPPLVAGTADTCAAGAHCYENVCRPICAGGNTAQCTNGNCIDFRDLEFSLCLPACNPLTQNCPDSANGDPQACYLLEPGPVCAGVYRDAAAGEPCDAANGCAPGAGCFGTPGRCYRYCDLVQCPPNRRGVWQPCPAHCPTDQVCQGVTGSDIYGVCVAP